MGRLVTILRRRSPVVHVVGPDQTVAEAVATMAQHQVGALPIVDGQRLIGIFTERDLLRRVIAKGASIDKTRVGEVMTPDPITSTPDEYRLSAIEKMQSMGCRHLPIVVADELLDMLSMRDLLFVELAERNREIQELRGYIHGSY
jgi:CBS domain-containing protein